PGSSWRSPRCAGCARRARSRRPPSARREPRPARAAAGRAARRPRGRQRPRAVGARPARAALARPAAIEDHRLPMRAILVERLGGPDVLQVREVDRPEPGPGETLVQVARAGINYTDLGRRTHGWKIPPTPLPVVPGWEVAGRRVGDSARVVGLLTTGMG